MGKKNKKKGGSGGNTDKSKDKRDRKERIKRVQDLSFGIKNRKKSQKVKKYVRGLKARIQFRGNARSMERYENLRVCVVYVLLFCVCVCVCVCVIYVCCVCFVCV